MGTTSSTPRRLVREVVADSKVESSATTSASRSSGAQQARPVFAYDFQQNLVPGLGKRERGYWRDVGTLDAYFQANMDLIAVEPIFNLYNSQWPHRHATTSLPPAKFVFNDEEQKRRGARPTRW